MNLQFLGAAGTVTGSKFLLTIKNKKILVDCGMFQGSREWREKNWLPPSFDPKEIDAVLLTHAHIDHCGMLPRYFKLGMKCPVYCTSATKDLVEILLEDAAKLQEEEASYRRDRNYSRHANPQALYDTRDARAACAKLKTCSWHKEHEILPNIFASWSRIGHIIGAGSITLRAEDRIINFSGDVGRYNVPILVNPEAINFGNHLLIEGTYGNRMHGDLSPKEQLKDVINATYNKKGSVIIPSFAVGRAQLLLFYLRELKEEKLIPDLPVVVDSPMAQDATTVYKQHPNDYDESTLQILEDRRMPFSFNKLAFTQSSEDSRKLNSITEPMIIIAGSGMMTGGRILHHLKHRITNSRNTILFVGYQAPGSRGAWLKGGAKTFKLFGHDTRVSAEIAEISGLSAHADKSELLRWCKESQGKPDKVSIVHAEPDAALDLKDTLTKELGWNCTIPKYLEETAI